MARISKKAKIEPVREANELGVENEVKVEKKVEKKSVKEEILEDVKRVATAKEEYGVANKLWLEEIEAILNKYL